MKDWNLKSAKDLGLPAKERFRSLNRESGLVSTGMQLAWWTMVRSYMSVWHRLQISGRNHIPSKPPFILVANHSSHLDALVLASPLAWRLDNRIFPLAAGDVFFQTPLVSAFAAGMLNALPIWRKKCGSHAMEQLRQRLLEEPCSFIIFPEGGRSRDGRLTGFKPGLGMLVAQTSVPVVPCFLDGCFEAMQPNQRIPRPRRIRLFIGEPVTFDSVSNQREGWLEIAQTMEQRVRALAPGQPAEG